MPLTPTEEVTDSGNDVVFAMMDGNQPVICRITKEGLADLSGLHADTPEERLRLFKLHAREIMLIAGVKYDAGEKLPVIGTEDVKPEAE